MRRAILAILLAGCQSAPVPEQKAVPSPRHLPYPTVKTVDQKDTLHGVTVADPYRWLEDQDGADTRAFVEAENKVTFDYLGKIPSRDAVKQRLTDLWDYERWSAPVREAGRYFFEHNSGLQNQPVLFWTTGLDAEPKLLLDPNTLAADGTTALEDYVVSPDGKLLAYSLAKAGSDWNEWHVRNVDTGKDESDLLLWAKFSTVSWTRDSKGFFYSRYPEPKAGQALEDANYNNKLYFHRLGDAQSKDTLVFERPDHKEWGFDGHVTHDGKFLLVTVWKGTDDKFALFYKALVPGAAASGQLVALNESFDAEYSFVGNQGATFFFKTNKDAPRGRLVAMDVKKPQTLVELVPEQKQTLESVTRVADTFTLSYLDDAHARLVIADLKGKAVRTIELPELGTVARFWGDEGSSEAFYSFESFTRPASVFRYDQASGASTLWKQPPVKFDPSEYETTQVFYESKDGTRVPMYITAKKGWQKDGQNPTLLYGYGGFNIPLTPTFSVANLVWMELGGVYAQANLRGGGEYGEAWHKAGTKHEKQHVFDDFIAAAEYLIREKVTSTPKLAIHGRSNGGLLVGAAITQRPDLFGAAIPGVGVMDMLRFHKFTIGWAWMDDYGSPDDAEDFKALYAYSPLHNIKKGTAYPPTLVITADHDDRVVPAHSFKFAATLQAAQAGDAPVLIRIETQAGHGAGKPTTKKIEEVTDQWAFLVNELHMDVGPATAKR